MVFSWALGDLGKFGWSAAFIYVACAALRRRLAEGALWGPELIEEAIAQVHGEGTLAGA